MKRGTAQRFRELIRLLGGRPWRRPQAHRFAAWFGPHAGSKGRDPETDERWNERLRRAVAGSNDALFDYDPVQRRIYLSNAFKGWIGAAEEADTQRDLSFALVLSRVPADHVDRVGRAFTDCSIDGRAFELEFPLSKPAGGHVWLQVRGRGVRQDNGSYRVSGLASDISRRKVAESLLHDSVERLATVLDNIAEGIVTLNAAGEVCSVNAAARRMFALGRDELVGKRFSDLIAWPWEGAAAWARVADGQPREADGVRASGAGFAAEFAVSTMQIRSDERFIVVLRDITERKIGEDRLRTAVEESQAATRAKDEFLATMSHEIRTPMNGVLGMTQLLLDMDLPGPQRETAELIRSSGQALLTIINDILDFTRAGSGRLRVDAVAFDLRQIVREVVELLGRRRDGVDVYVDFPLEVPGRVVGDAGRLRQVLLNLVGNALKFTEQGHVVVTVERLGESTGIVPVERLRGGDPAVAPGRQARFRIVVEDTGPGISEAARERLFEPFTQADASTTRRFGGTGLGLAISRRLVELMGGEIDLVSEPDQGSRFEVMLNLTLDDAAAAGAAMDPTLAGRRVLVVDDDARGRGLLAQALTGAGMVATTVDCAAAALALLETESFDIAVIDDRMPGMDGLLLCELIRIDDSCTDMRLLLMGSVHIRGVDESRAVDRCIVKPVMPDFLLGVVASLLDSGDDAGGSAAPGTGSRVAGSATPTAAPAALPAPQPAALRVPNAAGALPRALLAEDNVVNQKVAVRMLEKLGCRIDIAGDGAEAVEMWRHFDYDVVFMDCQMPELDGLEATRRIRKEERRAGRPPVVIIAMTANALDQDRVDCIAAGMNDYLSKPVSQEDLEVMLARWVRPAEGESAGRVGNAR